MTGIATASPCPHRQHGVEDVAEGAPPHAHHAARVLQAHRHQRLQHSLAHAALARAAREHAGRRTGAGCILLIHHQAWPLPGQHLLVHDVLQVLRHAAAAAHNAAGLASRGLPSRQRAAALSRKRALPPAGSC